MHGTRAVQKMIDFLSTQRQVITPIPPSLLPLITHLEPFGIKADIRYDAQIRSIIMALGLHVVTLIKDLNGNHVVQKCLNRLAPEDNQVCAESLISLDACITRHFFPSSFTTPSQRTVLKSQPIDTVVVSYNVVSIMRRTRSECNL
jgi:hypothetical protein